VSTLLINSLLVTILVICLITDLKERKIYNKIIFPGLIIALLLNFILGSWNGLLDSVEGLFIGLGILLIPYLMGGMGAGDVKLLALVGAFKGTLFVLYTAIYMALLGGIIAIGILLFQKGVLQRLRSVLYFVVGKRYGMKIPLILSKDAMKTTYPYGVAIAGGAFLSLFFKGWGLL
jgi:prepilin peptidase CpaA